MTQRLKDMLSALTEGFAKGLTFSFQVSAVISGAQYSLRREIERLDLL